MFVKVNLCLGACQLSLEDAIVAGRCLDREVYSILSSHIPFGGSFLPFQDSIPLGNGLLFCPHTSSFERLEHFFTEMFTYWSSFSFANILLSCYSILNSCPSIIKYIMAFHPQVMSFNYNGMPICL